MRLLVAVLTSVSMLHLTLVGSSLACSSGRADSAQGVMAMTDAPSHAEHAVSASPMGVSTGEHADRAQQNDERQAPAQQRCCESMSSCGLTTVAAEPGLPIPPARTARAAEQADDMLASVGVAPEPPPPKA
jgi:hypothetical protein